jgi:Fe-S oxidoreductase
VKEHTAGFEHFYSRGKMVIAQGILEEKIAPSPELAEVLYACSLCGNCQTQCGMIDSGTGLPLVDPPKVVEAMRADMLREHPEWVNQEYLTMLNAARQYDNPWGKPRTAKEKWTKGLTVKDAQKETADVLLFVGCTIPSHPLLTSIARKAVTILKAAEVDFAVLGNCEPCCGSVVKRVGAFGLAEEMMQKNIEQFNALGSSKIITLCAGCYHTLKKDYQTAKTPLIPKVYHMVEIMASLIERGKLNLQKENSVKVVYHDPCHLGRHMGIFDPPRSVLKALPGIEVVERTAQRENTICCGAGGGLRLFEGGKLSEQIGKASLFSAKDCGAEAVVTACPFCEINLNAGAKQLDTSLPVYDVIDLVSECLDRP